MGCRATPSPELKIVFTNFGSSVNLLGIGENFCSSIVQSFFRELRKLQRDAKASVLSMLHVDWLVSHYRDSDDWDASEHCLCRAEKSSMSDEQLQVGVS